MQILFILFINILYWKERLNADLLNVWTQILFILFIFFWKLGTSFDLSLDRQQPKTFNEK